MKRPVAASCAAVLCLAVVSAQASYVNFESSHVHPIDLTPSGARLLAVNTPDALLEVFGVGPGGALVPQAAIPVGLEPVTVVARGENEAWVVNHLSDTVSIVDLDRGMTVRTLPVGDEPTDVAFAGGRAFVTASQDDRVMVFSLADLSAPPIPVEIFSERPRALATSKDGTKVYAAALHSGNRTTVVNANVIFGNDAGLSSSRLQDLGLNGIACNTDRTRGGAPVPPYPPLPLFIERNPTLIDPPNGVPPVSLIVKWDPTTSRWRDEAGQDWTHCLPYRLPDRDLFVIDALTLQVTSVDHLGTSLFEVSVNPASGAVYVPHTEARNFVRFEHALGVRGYMVDNRMAIVDPAAGNAATLIDLNAHIDRDSQPPGNLLERRAAISQPGMLVWSADGSTGWLTAIGSRKLFRVSGACRAAGCIFGANRALPDAVEVGEGPTGVALHEGAGRAYVLNRFSNSIAVVDVAAMAKIAELPLHDPSDATVRDGRRLMYDGVDSSQHGDAACSTCHLSGDRDGLAWDLGDPTGTFAAYGTPGDNVRFAAFGLDCPPSLCASHEGFDPQKGPMATQTLRGMLEPLHWRGDRGTMNAFNKAFVGLMGTEDIGPVDGEPAGLSAASMALFRRFALAMSFPPNPYRNVDDTLPNAIVSIPGTRLAGNPRSGETLFNAHPSDGGQPCRSCHQHPFGATGGKLGGVEPGDPAGARAALFNGDADGSPHSDLKVPHLRNMYERTGPRFGDPLDPPADQKSGFGFIHDGAIPDMGTFLSAGVFNLTAQQARDIGTFMFFFPTGVRPSVGRNLTLPAGAPPTGAPAQEQLLGTLIAVGNAADGLRHCDLVATAQSGGRPRAWYLNGGTGAGGLWTTDVAGEAQVATAALRQGAQGPLTFLCATIGSGPRLGADRDEDARPNGDDCADGDAGSFGAPASVANVGASPAAAAGGATPVRLTWDDQAPVVGPGVRYDVAAGDVATARSAGLESAAACLAGALAGSAYDDARPDPPVGEALFYLLRARNACGSGGFGPGREALDGLACAP